MQNQREFWVFHFSLTALFSVAAFMALRDYRIWALGSAANLLIALVLVATNAQRKLLCWSFAASGLSGLALSYLRLPSGQIREEGILLFVLLLGVLTFIAYDIYRSQRDAAA